MFKVNKWVAKGNLLNQHFEPPFDFTVTSGKVFAH